MKELENLPNFSDDDLNRLEIQLREAEERVKEAKLYEILEKLQNEQRKQKALVDMYNDQIDHLRIEVDNIEEIAKALPDGCFKENHLEL